MPASTTSAKGPCIRSDAVGLIIYKRLATTTHSDSASEQVPFQFLQLRRAKAPYLGTWSNVAGGIEQGEHSVTAALREAWEEAGLDPQSSHLLNMHSVDGVQPFYSPTQDAIWMMPYFAAEVSPSWQPSLNSENDGDRWIDWPTHQCPDTGEHKPATDFCIWDGQRNILSQIARNIVPEDAPQREHLKIAVAQYAPLVDTTTRPA